ncbi:hypothetical protein [Thermanaerothrix sp.]|uniref:hypothetical protein n=1 Tax=Thermanaerothrix sp. TaxID=2972675 RepID=UPI002ADD5AE3|nr:hypothetical protein [Thermanaerothrix sp.]
MNQKNKKLHLLARGFYLLGAVTLLASLALSLVASPAGAANTAQGGTALEVSQIQVQQGAGNCFASGSSIKDNNGNDGWAITAPAGKVFTEVAVKAGAEQSGGGCFYTQSDRIIYISNNACYQVSGIGTGTVTVTQLTNNNICKGISHIEGIYGDPVMPSPSPSETVTPTESATPTETVTPTESATPTETVTPTESATPTETVTPTESATPTETVTETAIIPPTGDNTPTPDPGQPTATPEPGQPTQPTTPPTLPPPPPPPPSSGQPGLLIPVTGADQTQTHSLLLTFLASLGFAFLGLGMLTHSAARRAENAVRH